jgi:isopenicillin-N epimerase
MLRDLFLLDPNIIFLNHGSFGACPRPVFRIYQSWQKRLEKQPVKFLGNELNDLLFSARKILGNYIKVPAEDIVFVPNATHGVNIIARSIKLSPGDEVLSTDQEYGACDFTWQFVCQKVGAKYKKQAIDLPVASAEEITEKFWQAVTPHTKLIFVSHITSPTSLRLPIELICKRAQNSGILTVIDGAHAPGQIPLNLTDLGADFYTGNCHKWMMSPKGAGFLYTRPGVQNLVEPLIVSWGYQSHSMPSRESTFIDCLQWTGTHDPAAYLSVPAAIDFMEHNHWGEVRVECHKLLRSAINRICNQNGMTPLYPLDSSLYHQMGTIPIPHLRDISELKTNLYWDYKIEIPCIEWNGKHFIRLSIQGYNTGAEIDQLIHALLILIPQLRVLSNSMDE